LNTKGVIAIMTKHPEPRRVSKILELTVKNMATSCINILVLAVYMIYHKKFNRMRPTWLPVVVTGADQATIGHYYGKAIFVSGFFYRLPSLFSPGRIFGPSRIVLCIPFFDMFLVFISPYGHRYLSAFRRHWLMRGRAIIDCTARIRAEFGGFSLCLKCLFAPGTYIFV